MQNLGKVFRGRGDGLLADLLRRAESQELSGEGVRLRFSADAGTLLAIAHVVDAERLCCRCLRFSITVEPDGGPIALELTVPAGTRTSLT